MTMRAIVHVGLPKTGTTSIQSWLQQNAPALLERGVAYDRIHYPGLKRRRAHVELGICQAAEANVEMPHTVTRRVYGLSNLAAQKEVADTYAKTFAKAVKKHPGATWVFSSEDLGSLTRTPELARALDTWLRRFFDDVHYVCYIRRQEDWLLSRYSQTLRQGMAHTLDEFLEKRARHDFHAMASAWRDGIGADHFDLRLLEPDAMKDGDLIADFCDAIGVDPAGLPAPERKNEALSVPAAEFLRQANQRWPSGKKRFQRPRKLIEDLEPFLMGKAGQGRKLTLTADNIAMIRAANADSNERLRRDFFPDRREMFAPKSKPAPTDPATNQATVDEIAAIGLALWRAFRMNDLKAMTPAERRAFRKSGPGGKPARGTARAERAAR